MIERLRNLIDQAEKNPKLKKILLMIAEEEESKQNKILDLIKSVLDRVF